MHVRLPYELWHAREAFYMALPAGDGSRGKDQIPKGEACYENDQDERRNAIHTPHVQHVSFNIREVERIGDPDTGRVDREHSATQQRKHYQ